MSDPFLRTVNLKRATVAQEMMSIHFQRCGLSFEDRSQRGFHNFLASSGANQNWHLAVHIDFGGGESNEIEAAATLRYGDRIVYELMYSGAKDHWMVIAHVSSDDSPSWDELLPFRKELIQGAQPEHQEGSQIDLRIGPEDCPRILTAVANFYLKRSSVHPTRVTSAPPPPSEPPKV